MNFDPSTTLTNQALAGIHGIQLDISTVFLAGVGVLLIFISLDKIKDVLDSRAVDLRASASVDMEQRKSKLRSQAAASSAAAAKAAGNIDPSDYQIRAKRGFGSIGTAEKWGSDAGVGAYHEDDIYTEPSKINPDKLTHDDLGLDDF